MSIRNPKYRCPACGGHCMMIDSVGYIICTWLECPNPTALHNFITALEPSMRIKTWDEWKMVIADILSKVGSELGTCQTIKDTPNA